MIFNSINEVKEKEETKASKLLKLNYNPNFVHEAVWGEVQRNSWPPIKNSFPLACSAICPFRSDRLDGFRASCSVLYSQTSLHMIRCAQN